MKKTLLHICETEYAYERFALQAIGFFLCCIVITYAYLVSAAVLHVMHDRENSAQIETTRSAIAESEKEYFELSKQLTPALATSMGLVPLSNDTTYVTREPLVGANPLARNEN